MKKARNSLVILGVVGIAVAAVATTSLSVQAGEDISSNPLQTPIFQPADSMPTISPSEAAAERAKNFPPLQPADPSIPLADVEKMADAALDLANGEGRDKPLSQLSAEEKASFPVFAVETTYAKIGTFYTGLSQDYQINQDRPIWGLTVHAKIVNDAPYGMEAKSWEVYTAVFDAVSGDMISSSTGIDLEELGSEGSYLTLK